MPAPIDPENSDRDDRAVDEIVGRGPSGPSRSPGSRR
jgi:hypothetical protein